MSCIGCPYGDLIRRHSYGIYEDEFDWCEKCGGKHFGNGWCSDAEFEFVDRSSDAGFYKAVRRKNNIKKFKEPVKRNKYRRTQQHHNKLKSLYVKSNSHYPPAVIIENDPEKTVK